MARANSLAAWMIVVATTAVIWIGSPVAVAAPRGTLTAAEYQQLTVATAALNRSASATAIDWPRARAACARVGRSTALLRTQRATCFGSVNVLDALASFPAEQRSCAKSSATTTTGATTTGTATTGTTSTGTATTGTGTATTTATGTTTTPADSAAIRVTICMNPHYQALGRDAKLIDRADIAARTQALARGFSGACLAALAPTKAELGIAGRFASSTAKLATDVTLLIRVIEGKLPASDFDQTQIDNDVKLFETSATAVLVEHGQPKLSVCPHK